MGKAAHTLAAFDFDDTLIEGDSLWPFLTAVAGLPRAVAALVAALALYVASCARRDLKGADFRTFLKAQLIERLLKGMPVSRLAPALEKLRLWRKWNECLKATLLDHHAKGHHIVIISGALNLYLPDLARELPYDDLICTKVGIADGVITGDMPEGNCARAHKAVVLAGYIEKNGPFADSWGYGNFPHDLPMLELLRRRVIV
jgi:HAD superfamily phosphoserine phosphatase-like hydrolase